MAVRALAHGRQAGSCRATQGGRGLTVLVSTYLRKRDGDLTNIRDVDRYDGDRDHVEGAVVISIDGVEVMSADVWDDVDWLWPFMVDAVAKCRDTGAGETSFPDQALAFGLERLPTGRLLVWLRRRDERRAATVKPAEFYRAFAAAGLEFFDHHRRLVRGASRDERRLALLRSWLAP